MNNETNVEMMNEVIETGTEIVTNVAGNNDLMKKIGIGAGYAVAGAVVYEGTKRLIGFIKSKAQKRKNEKDQHETSDEKTESIES